MALADRPTERQRAAFARGVSIGTGLRFDVVYAWSAQENGPYYNQLNILRSGTQGAGGVINYGSLAGGIAASVALINTSPYYAGIRRTRGASPALQIAAISASPWDISHYGGGGKNLFATFGRLFQGR